MNTCTVVESSHPVIAGHDRVSHSTGQTAHLHSLEELVAFISRVLAGVQTP